MRNEVLAAITALNTEVIVFDIDGTLKDLVKEHQETLKILMNHLVRRKDIRNKIVFLLDRLAMWTVKAGVLPTNERMQNVLILIYSFILGVDRNNFKELYSFFYQKQVSLFDDAKDLLDEVSKVNDIYFVTINKQNYNLEEQGINGKRIVYTIAERKINAYQRLFDENGIDKSKTVIIGDNIFDDIIAAKKLGVSCLLVNNYNSKFKCCIAKLLNVGM